MRHQRRLHRRLAMLSMLAVLAAMAGCRATATDVDALLRDAIVVDTHIDAPYRIERSGADLSARTTEGQFDLVRAAEGRLGVAFMSIFVPPADDEAGRGVALAHREIDHVDALAARSDGHAQVVRCVEEARRVATGGGLALALGLENGGPLSAGREVLGDLVGRGVRYVTLAHAKSNAFADSSYDRQKRWQGLSPAGVAMVRRLNEAGVMLDVSHLSDASATAIVDASEVPVIASHSAARHFTPDFERNASDALIRAIAAKGGVIQVLFGSTYLTAEANAWQARRQESLARYRAETGFAAESPQARAFLEEFGKRQPMPRASLEDVLDHIEYVIALTGPEHVGIGSDFDGVGDTLPVGLEDVTAYPALAAGLAGRGHRGAELRGILGGNLLRVWSAAEAFAQAHGAGPACASRAGFVQ